MLFFRLAMTLDFLLMLLGHFVRPYMRVLPLGGSDFAQIGILLGVVLVVLEVSAAYRMIFVRKTPPAPRGWRRFCSSFRRPKHTFKARLVAWIIDFMS